MFSTRIAAVASALALAFAALLLAPTTEASAERGCTREYRPVCALKRDGRVFCFGANSAGELGVGDLVDRPSPALVDLPRPAREIASRENHTCAILDDGALMCWGANAEGQLGLADGFPGADRATPTLVSGGHLYIAVATGQGHTCAIAFGGRFLEFGAPLGQSRLCLFDLSFDASAQPDRKVQRSDHGERAVRLRRVFSDYAIIGVDRE